MSRRRRRSSSGALLYDTAATANRLPWQGSLILGVVGFSLFYWFLPDYLTDLLASRHQSQFYPILESIFARRIHWLQWLGIALAIVCGFFGVKNYFFDAKLSRAETHSVGWISRLLASWFD